MSEAMLRRVTTVRAILTEADELQAKAKAQLDSAREKHTELITAIRAGDSTGDVWLDWSITDGGDLSGVKGKKLQALSAQMAEHAGELILFTSVNMVQINCTGFGADPEFRDEFGLELAILGNPAIWSSPADELPLQKACGVRSLFGNDIRIYSEQLIHSIKSQFFLLDEPYVVKADRSQRWWLPDILYYHLRVYVGDVEIERWLEAVKDLGRVNDLSVQIDRMKQALSYDPSRLFQ